MQIYDIKTHLSRNLLKKFQGFVCEHRKHRECYQERAYVSWRVCPHEIRPGYKNPADVESRENYAYEYFNNFNNVNIISGQLSFRI